MATYEIMDLETGKLCETVHSELDASKWIDKRVESAGHDPARYRVDPV